MKKGIVRISVPNYSPERAAGKPYRPSTYSQRADASRISIKNQAGEYARFVKARGIKTLYLYPERKGTFSNSNRFRFYLERALNGFKRGDYTIVEVDPDEFLGGLKS